MPSLLLPRGNQPSLNSEAGEVTTRHFTKNHVLSWANLIQDFTSGFPKMFTSLFWGIIILARMCAGYSSSWNGEIQSCYMEQFYADESGCKVWFVEMSSKEKPAILHVVLWYHGFYVKISLEKRDLALLCCTSWADWLWGFHMWFLSSIKHWKIQVEHTCLFKTAWLLD